jgi:hypothetical protein
MSGYLPKYQSVSSPWSFSAVTVSCLHTDLGVVVVVVVVVVIIITTVTTPHPHQLVK